MRLALIGPTYCKCAAKPHTAEHNASILVNHCSSTETHTLLETAVRVNTPSVWPEGEIKRMQQLVSLKIQHNSQLSIVNKDSHKALSHVVPNGTYLTI